MGFSFLGSWCVCLCLWARGLEGLQGGVKCEVHDCKKVTKWQGTNEICQKRRNAQAWQVHQDFFGGFFHVCYLHNNSTGASFLPCDFQRPDRHVTIIEMRRRSNDLVFICHVRGSKGVG